MGSTDKYDKRDPLRPLRVIRADKNAFGDNYYKVSLKLSGS